MSVNVLICSATNPRVSSFRNGICRTQSSPRSAGFIRKYTKKIIVTIHPTRPMRYFTTLKLTFTAFPPYCAPSWERISCENCAGSVKNRSAESGTPSFTSPA